MSDKDQILRMLALATGLQDKIREERLDIREFTTDDLPDFPNSNHMIGLFHKGSTSAIFFDFDEQGVLSDINVTLLEDDAPVHGVN